MYLSLIHILLAYMLENRGEEAEPEKLDQEKYEVVKKRQEERRQRQENVHAGHAEYAGRMERRDNIIPMPTAVSYTHLDVYKRQIPGRSNGSPAPEIIQSVPASTAALT